MALKVKLTKRAENFAEFAQQEISVELSD